MHLLADRFIVADMATDNNMAPSEILTALLSMRVFAASQEWSVEAGTDVTGWNACAECGADDFRGHEPNCIVPSLFARFDSAISRLKTILDLD